MNSSNVCAIQLLIWYLTERGQVVALYCLSVWTSEGLHPAFVQKNLSFNYSIISRSLQRTTFVKIYHPELIGTQLFLPSYYNSNEIIWAVIILGAPHNICQYDELVCLQESMWISFLQIKCVTRVNFISLLLATCSILYIITYCSRHWNSQWFWKL